MTRLGSVDFDERILNAIRDDKLVIFAGAGVSMGSPSNLPDFRKLAKDIASGTGLVPEEKEPLDRFLGSLNKNGIDVHQRAIKHLSPEGSKPNDLHRNIIRLFRDSKRIRLITTNFDLLFEKAYRELQNDDSFSEAPNIYRAPALPQGYDFNGIVYVHGALPQLSSHRAKDMVLTDADFGRAYLTEGWARRFLVDVFREFTVLFIGYSHDDVIMKYLARALPGDRLAGRFALTEEPDKWKLLGIEPIIFGEKDPINKYIELYDSINQLAKVTSRGVLEWNQRIIELSKIPPTDEDALKGEIKHILERDDTTKLFTKHIRGEEWPAWLEEQGHLKALFNDQPLNNRDEMLAKWLAKDYLNTHPDTLLKLAFKYNLKLNPRLWEQLGREVGKNKSLEKTTFERWVDILITTKPAQTHRESPCYDFVLSRIAKQSHEHEAPLSALKAFMAMNDYDLKASFHKTKDWSYQFFSANHHMHSEDTKRVWKNYIKPHLESISTQLLKSTTGRLEEISNSLHIWNPDDLELGWNRMAIETLDEDYRDNINTTDIDTLVDAARDTLEFLGTKDSESLDLWTSILIKSKAPILRRLAIHASTINTNRQPEEKLKWIIENCDLSTQPEHHEMYHAAEISYKLCKESIRHEFVKQILDIRSNSNNQGGINPERQSIQKTFNWLTWLLKVMPSCNIAKQNLSKIKTETPDLKEPPTVEFPYWFNIIKHHNTPSISPVKKPQTDQIEQIDDVKIEKTYEDIIDSVYRKPLLHEIIELFSQSPEYILNLAKELSKLKQQNSDFLDHILHCLGRVNLTKNQCVSILDILNNTDLIKNQGKWVSTLLLRINQNTNGLLLHPDLINTTNNLTRNIWTSIYPKFISSTKENWIFESVDSTDGTLVLFWIEEVRLKISNSETTQQTLPDHYKRLFETIISDSLERGHLGIPILLMHTNLLFSLDELWTRQNIIPLLTFNDQDQNHRFEQAWDGLLETGDLNPVLIRDLECDTLSALSNLKGKDRRSKLMKLLSRIVINHDSNPNEELIPRIFNDSSKDEIVCFYNQLWHSLPDSKNNEQLKSIWGRWMKNHFENRIENIPTKLNNEETAFMVDIITSMLHSNPDAILLISKLPKIHTPRYFMICKELQNHELLETHPNETAQVIIHILGCSEIDDQLSEIIKGIIDTLLGKVSKTLKRRLEEEKVLLS